MTSPEAVCERVSAEMHAFYAKNREALGNRGYRVMYGPPVMNPPILFIGYQPGGAGPGDDDLSDERTPLWPAECDYAVKDWRLAKAMRRMFPGVLDRCTGLNAIFVRSPTVATYVREVGIDLRRETEAFCRPRVEAIVEALSPAIIVIIGFSSLQVFGQSEPALTNARGRNLVREGRIADRPAFATLHLSGAQIARTDRAAIADFLLTRAAL
jgi:hypothetical protein